MRRERGMALITVLLVVAVVSVVCAGIITRQQLSIRSAANQLEARQAWHYALGGELLAKAMLERDSLEAKGRVQVDHLGEAWALPRKAYPLDDGGELRVQISDLTGRFNLNSLWLENQPNEAAIAQFRRLLLGLQISTPYAERLLDWLDPDEQLYSENGAEDDQYLLAETPYRAANQGLADPSELRLLLGMSESDYRRLLPYVCALPAEVPLNINTASEHLLASLADGISRAQAQALIQSRAAQGFTDVQAFTQQLNGVLPKGQALAVSSDYFQVETEVVVGQRRQLLRSILQRTNEGEVYVLARDLGRGAVLLARQGEVEP